MYLQIVIDFFVLKSLHIFYIYLPSYVCFYAFPMLCQRLLICKALNDDLAIIKFAFTKYDLQIGGSKIEYYKCYFLISFYNFEIFLMRHVTKQQGFIIERVACYKIRSKS